MGAYLNPDRSLGSSSSTNAVSMLPDQSLVLAIDEVETVEYGLRAPATRLGHLMGLVAFAVNGLTDGPGTPSRLDRDLVHPVGSVCYAKEELRAEIAP